MIGFVVKAKSKVRDGTDSPIVYAPFITYAAERGVAVSDTNTKPKIIA
jgi:hypothetical protein